MEYYDNKGNPITRILRLYDVGSDGVKYLEHTFYTNSCFTFYKIADSEPILHGRSHSDLFVKRGNSYYKACLHTIPVEGVREHLQDMAFKRAVAAPLFMWRVQEVD